MLGATEVWLDGHLLDLGAHKPRAVLAVAAGLTAVFAPLTTLLYRRA